jgi:hypothetical protein
MAKVPKNIGKDTGVHYIKLKSIIGIAVKILSGKKGSKE